MLIGDSEFDGQSAKAAKVFFVGFKMDGDVRIDTLAGLAEICLAHKVGVGSSCAPSYRRDSIYNQAHAGPRAFRSSLSY